MAYSSFHFMTVKTSYQEFVVFGVVIVIYLELDTNIKPNEECKETGLEDKTKINEFVRSTLKLG